MQTQRLRRLAVHVLLLWLFAFSTGIVNACVVQMHAGQPQQVMSHEDHGTHQHASGHEQHQTDHGNLPCERFCDEPSVVAQPVKQQSDATSHSWPAAAPAPSFEFQALSGAFTGTRASSTPRWADTVPIPIAFLRLTL
jgi:hypothetical protein